MLCNIDFQDNQRDCIEKLLPWIEDPPKMTYYTDVMCMNHVMARLNELFDNVDDFGFSKISFVRFTKKGIFVLIEGKPLGDLFHELAMIGDMLLSDVSIDLYGGTYSTSDVEMAERCDCDLDSKITPSEVAYDPERDVVHDVDWRSLVYEEEKL